MDRLNKKCFVASTGLHLLLGVAICVGPAFTGSNTKKEPDLPVINFEPDILTDSEVVGGGNPKAGRPPVAQPPVPQPQPQPPPARPEPKPMERRQPDPPPEPEKRTDPDSFDEKAVKKPKGPQISLKMETKKANKKPSPAVDTAAENRRYAENMRRMADIIHGASEAVRSGTASATMIEGSPGPGGGGPSYASYRAWVERVFDAAWLAPEDATAERAVARVRIVIARDGTVTSAQFTERSSDAAVNASVQRALDRVPSVGRPFPEGSKDSERVFILKFDAKLKRGIA